MSPIYWDSKKIISQGGEQRGMGGWERERGYHLDRFLSVIWRVCCVCVFVTETKALSSVLSIVLLYNPIISSLSDSSTQLKQI